MKKVLIGLAIAATAFGASAQHTSNSMIRGHGWQGPQYQHHHGGNGWGWVVPAVIGGAVVYAATRPDPVIVQQPQVIVQQPPVIMQPSDIVYVNGVAYRRQITVINGQYQEILVRI
jgi:hypothetical protein